MSKINSVCIIDDDKVHTYILTKLIQKFELSDTIFSFSNGEIAMEAFLDMASKSRELPNVILLDINMPEMDGWEFIDEFRKLKKPTDKKTAIYISSSSISSEDQDKAASYPEVLNYLAKPIEPHTLLTIIREDWLKSNF